MKNLAGVLDNFKDKKILVIGDIILDKLSWGEVDRVNPEQPAAPLVRVYGETYALGGAANVANNIVSLQGNCTLYGIIGNDFFGKKLKELCKEKKIKFKSFYEKSPTIVKQRIMAHRQQVTRVDYGEVNLKKADRKIKNKIVDSLKKEIGKYDFMILSDYNKNIFSKDLTKEIIDLSNSKGLATLVDPKPNNVEFFKNCKIICPNEKEASIMTNIKYNNGKPTLKKMAKKLAEKVNSKAAIITCGKDGVFSYDREKQDFFLIGTEAKEVRDVAGAGDTFMATLALGLTCDLDLHDAVKLANYSSGIVVTKPGIAVPTIDELMNKIQKNSLKRRQH